MAGLDETIVKIKNYKSFGPEEQGYTGIRPVNLIIGKNNTGKSTLLDLVDYATRPKDLGHLGHRGQRPEVTVVSKLTEAELSRVFQDSTSGGPIPGSHGAFGRRWIGQLLTWRLEPQADTGGRGQQSFVSIDPPFDLPNMRAYEQRLASTVKNPFSEHTFKKLLADRDIVPEHDKSEKMVSPNGDGTTNIFHHFINKAELPRELVEETVLGELNEIFKPDANFTDLVVQQLEDERWELYLEEAEKGTVPLSHTGSGIKTMLLVLAFLHLVPYVEDKPLSSYLFGFEELENNLHPALQRRLLLYLRRVAVERKCTFFLTTHSNITIDLFANDNSSQIIHVTHDQQQAFVRTVTTYVDNKGILDDLDVRASDLLQSNGVVWVEGPSDRLYFNRWIDVFSEGELREGTHYQCVFYGGRLLAHLSASDPDVDEEEAVKVLRVNRNALIIIDSDRRKPRQQINGTKRRIISEIEEVGDMAWVTAGKEVENYIPANALKSLYNTDDLPPLDQYVNFSDYLETVKSGEGARFLRNKVLFAERVIPHFTRSDLEEVLDLKKQMNKACKRINDWNEIT